MKTAFHLHAVRSHFRARMPSEEEQALVFDWVRREGFDGLDISDSWGFDAFDEAAARSTRRLAHERGLPIATISCMARRFATRHWVHRTQKR